VLPTAIEVADISLAYDRDIKLPLYAAADIPELWIVDLAGGQVLVYREPRGGCCHTTTAVKPGGILAPQAVSDLGPPVVEILG
jgi:Uma2 family endonuclease